MRHLSFALLSCVALTAAPGLAEAGTPTLELRITPPWLRPYGMPSLGAIMAFPVGERLWLGGGYELIQDYDAILWTSSQEGHKPIVMSAVRAGAWYRGGARRHGWSWAAGGIVSAANSLFSLATSPKQLDRGTYVFDVGPELSLGRAGKSVRVEVFATPAWSMGRVASPAVHRTETLSAFTYRVGVAFAILLGD